METGLCFSLDINGPDKADFDVVDFELEEALSELFTLTIKVSSPRSDIDLNQQLLQRASFTVYADGQKQRIVNGIVEQAIRGDSGFKRSFYTFVIRPEMWQLTLSQDSRIYHFMSVPDILDSILRENQIEFDKQLMDSHSQREYVTQKRESPFAFFCRLAAEEGITFWFEEGKLFYSDSHLGMTAGVSLIYNPHPQSAAKEPVITRLEFGASVKAGETILKDYKYTHPDVAMLARSAGQKSKPFSVYDSYGRYDSEENAALFARYRHEARQAESEAGFALSNCFALMPGLIFDLAEHPVESMNVSWQVVRIVHKGSLPQSLADENTSDIAATLTNEFSFISGKRDWRTPFIAKPLADGDEIATVVGPSGEEIYVNEDGAVKIHFHWNRYDRPDENASSWVRVMQGWNGGGFGFLATPRIGQEVIVSYLNGDIDRPIISGAVYNGNNRPPVKLPENKTQTTFKTQTHKGVGFNELRFEDEAGKEEIFVHAQRDMRTQVNREQLALIGENRITHIKQDDYLKVDGETRFENDGDYSLSVGKDSHSKVAGKLLLDSGNEIHLHSGKTIILDAGSEIVLKAGATFISISAAGIRSSHPIPVNQAMPNLGTPVAPKLPQALKAVEPERKMLFAQMDFSG